jgi:hypothetical protein
MASLRQAAHEVRLLRRYAVAEREQIRRGVVGPEPTIADLMEVAL